MIIFPVEIKELLICQLRDHFRVSAGLICIGGVREERVQDHPVQHSLRGRERSLHLIVNHAADLQVCICIVQLIAPSLLTECLVTLINIRIEYRIHIHMHQILEILVIAARHRVYRLVRIGHGI